MRVGIDVEQFARDPYGSGIQRVLQYLAKDWPSVSIDADFVFPDGPHFALVDPESALEIFSIPFGFDPATGDVRAAVTEAISNAPGPRVSMAGLLGSYTTWLLPEVSYLPSVLERMRIFNASMTSVMIGYDTLPMSEPANYRFPPGMVAHVSEYFRLLAQVDRAVCISRYARNELWEVLRRPRNLSTTVAHPGGDHGVPLASPRIRPATQHAHGPVRFLRLGTLEARKKPLEILWAFQQAHTLGANVELVFIGSPSASNAAINAEIDAAARGDLPVRWIQGASDSLVRSELEQSDVFLSIGTEGYGIPVLEAIALAIPVVYSGVQPAGEIMNGRGATALGDLVAANISSVSDDSGDQLVAMFRQLSDPAAVAALREEIDANAIPRWRDFVTAVAQACRN